MKFQNKANRDAAAARMQDDADLYGKTVRKGSQRNVILSPDYVKDYEGTPSPNGFGGSAPEAFSVIYTLTVS